MSLVPVEPSGAAAAAAAAASSPRAPERSLNGVLQWLIEQAPEAVAEAAASPSGPSVAAMEADRREFLANVMAEMMQSDYLARVKEALACFTEPTSSLHDRCEALETIAEECEDLNVASDFGKVGGAPVITSSLLASDPDIVWRALEVVAVLTQNLASLQELAHQQEYMTLVAPLLAHPSAQVKSKAARAISAMVRGSPDLLHDFLRQPNGIADCLAIVGSADPGAATKAVVLLKHLLRLHPACQDAIMDGGYIPALRGALQADEDGQLWEHGLECLCASPCALPVSLLCSAVLPALEALVASWLLIMDNTVGTLLQDRLNLLESDADLVQLLAHRRAALNSLPHEEMDAHQEELEHLQCLLAAVQL